MIEMVDYVVFETPGALDPLAVKTFGINSKPHTDNPIGYFGTGLKYAIAVLMRTGHELIINSGGRTYRFETRTGKFREKSFDFIFMNGDQLPFTTELGKTWELWQAFRELYANTLDENGETYCSEALPPPKHRVTQIVVAGPGILREFDERYSTFLRHAQRTGYGVQILPSPSSRIFFRGMRVMDLKKPSLLTYNILSPIDLTEDRTAKYMFQVHDSIASALAGHNDAQLLQKVLSAGEDSFESEIDFSNIWQTPTEEFVSVSRTGRNRSAYKFGRDHDPEWLAQKKLIHPFDQMAQCIKAGEWNMFLVVAKENDNALLALLIGAPR